MSKDHRKNCVIAKGKYKIRASERKWTDIEYPVQGKSDVAHKYVKMYCNTNQFPSLPFFGPHSKPHGARGLSKHYNFRFDPKLVNGVCAILLINCACVACTSILDKPWISGTSERYQPFTKCTYWQVLGSSKKWNIIQLSHKSNYFGAFGEIQHVVLDGISDNMASLV